MLHTQIDGVDAANRRVRITWTDLEDRQAIYNLIEFSHLTPCPNAVANMNIFGHGAEALVKDLTNQEALDLVSFIEKNGDNLRKKPSNDLRLLVEDLLLAASMDAILLGFLGERPTVEETSLLLETLVAVTPEGTMPDDVRDKLNKMLADAPPKVGCYCGTCEGKRALGRADATDADMRLVSAIWTALLHG